MQVLCTFGINMLIFFEYMQVWWTSSLSNLHILKKNKHFDREKLRSCIYSKKINILMPKAHKTCIYSKKSKVLIVKSHQTCIYSEKSKKIKNQFIYASQSHIESEIFDFFDFFEYMQVWWLFTIETFDFFEYMQVLCTFGINMLIFFEYMQVWCVLSKYCIFCFSCRFWRGISHKTCRGYAILKWTKLKLKTESGFDVLSILFY